MESQNNRNQGQNGQIIAWDIAHQLTTSSSCYGQSLGGFWDNLNGSGSTTNIVPFYHPPPRPPPQISLYGSGSDPHLTCLRLGKRHYFEDAAADLSAGGWASDAAGKKGKAAYGGVGGVPRCQVEGCGVALVSAKDYHKRHKVCEIHAKAPKVVVLGLVQRFCQQCSRFHAVSEFDDAKRSCRRRLAGHNERRRKSSQSQGMGRALSLLSSKDDSWVQPSDLSIRSRSALHELIAEHRATILARQPIYDENSSSRYHVVGIGEGEAQLPGSSSLGLQCTHHMLDEPTSWELGLLEARTHETLDLLQASTPSSTLGMLSVRENGNSKEEESYEMWSSFEGAHVI